MGTPLTSVFRHHKKLVDCQRFDSAHIGLHNQPSSKPQRRPCPVDQEGTECIRKAIRMDQLDETNDEDLIRRLQTW